MASVIDHVIVLVLENRSFDHMLGYLPHPDSNFDGLRGAGPYQNHGWEGAPAVTASADAKQVLPVDPDHSHDAVMLQTGASDSGHGRQPDNQGFVDSYERKGRGLAAPQFEGVLAPVIDLVTGGGGGTPITGRGPLIMRCQAPEQVPVLSQLALEYAVCTRWFSSVPGETWPNRNFLHAATSDGTTNIELRLYNNKTIFEVLEEAGKSWHIYYDDTPQVWAFNELWEGDARKANWFRSSDFGDHVRSGQLPNYSFIEPNHKPPVHVFDGQGNSTSQHPGNNLIADSDYDTSPANGPGDFARGEALIAEVYEALRANPQIFERSVLLVTYDEHGGFYDHVPPPTGIPAPSGESGPGLLGEVEDFLFRKKAASFDFTMLGVRVPAVVVSPYVPPGTVDTTTRDHASVPATLRALFAPAASSLTQRDAWSPPFHTLLSLDQPRTDDLPDLSGHLADGHPPASDPVPAPALAASQGSVTPVPEHFHELVLLAGLVDRKLPGPTSATADPWATAEAVTNEFQGQAELARGQTPAG
jgi:phospholipase C